MVPSDLFVTEDSEVNECTIKIQKEKTPILKFWHPQVVVSSNHNSLFFRLGVKVTESIPLSTLEIFADGQVPICACICVCVCVVYSCMCTGDQGTGVCKREEEEGDKK